MTLHHADPWLTVHQGDWVDVLREMDAESVHCVVTSPPYWGLRDYGTATWVGGDEGCVHRVPATGSTQNKANNNREGAPFRGVCGVCGAIRQDSQLGLEPTPEAYVARLVEGFREVRRVLRNDGTLWLNLGDSYAATASARDVGRSFSVTQKQEMRARGERVEGATFGNYLRDIPSGLKPKDLVGIPWRVAFALQQPYYVGRIKNEADRIWLAAMVDAEGCIHIHRRAAGSSAHSTYERKDGTTANYVRKNDTFGVMVSVDNTSQAIVDRCAAIFGQGSRYVDEAGTKVQQRKQTLYRWTVTGDQARDLLRELYPYLIAKQHQARIAIGSPSSGGADAQEAIKALHAGREVTLDYPAPVSLYEPGWYLRSDVIWAKSNPMPESVTDRPTKAHEYLFLLSKSARYFYDAAAVAEPTIRPQDADLATDRNGIHPGLAWTGSARVYGVDPTSRNLRSVWTVATQPYPGAHFATFPRKLVEPCVKAGCPEGGTVLDPFAGSGTTGLVANALSRRAVLIDLNTDYLDQAMTRNAQTPIGLVG